MTEIKRSIRVEGPFQLIEQKVDQETHTYLLIKPGEKGARCQLEVGTIPSLESWPDVRITNSSGYGPVVAGGMAIPPNQSAGLTIFRCLTLRWDKDGTVVTVFRNS